MSDEQGLVNKVPPELWLAYEKRAADYAAMYGNGSSALKTGILRLTLEAWLSGQSSGVPPMTPDIREKAERLMRQLDSEMVLLSAKFPDYDEYISAAANILSQALLEAHNAGRAEMREEAAKLVEDHGHSNGNIRAANKHLATAIRSIK